MKFTLSEMQMISEAVKLAIRSTKRIESEIIDTQIEVRKERKYFKDEKAFLDYRNELIEESLKRNNKYQSMLALSEKIDGMGINIEVDE